MAETSPAAGTGSALRLVVNSDLQLLFGCVVCGGSLSEPVLFGGCLHSACRKCFVGLCGSAPAPASSGDGDVADAGCSSTASGSGDGDAADADSSCSDSGCLDRLPDSGLLDGGLGGSSDVATAEANATGSQHSGNVVVPCPACGAMPPQAIACGGQKVNIFVAALQRAQAIACGGKAPCDFCPNDKDATPQPAARWCPECNKCICNQCTGWHGKFNKNHVTKALAAPGGSGDGMRCDTCAADGDQNRCATRWCPECMNVLCDSCTQWHDRFQRTHRTHVLAAGDVIINQGLLIAPPCRQHGARVEMYCRSCDGLCCADCTKPCLEASHDVYIVDGARTKEYIDRALADLKAAESSLSDRAAVLAPPPPSSDDGTTSAAGGDNEDDAEKLVAEALRSAMAADQATLSSSRQRAVEAVGCAFDELEGRVKNHYEALRRSLLLPDEQQQQQQQSRGTSGVRTTKTVLRDAISYALLYSRMLLQMADMSIVLDQHASLLASMRALLDRADRATNLLPTLEQLKPIVQSLDAASFDSLLAAHFTHLLLPSPGSDEKSSPLLSRTCPATSSGTAVAAVTSVTAASRPQANDTATVCSNEPVGDSSAVDDNEDVDGIGIGDAIRQITTDGNLRDVAVTDDGLVLIADAGKGLRQFSSAGKKLATWHAPKSGDRSKAGVVSTVCMLDDGRVAVGVISSSCIVLLRSAQTTGGASGETASDSERWIEDGQIKLDGAPYHVAARRDALAVALARSDEHKVDLGGVSAVVGSNWGPGPRVDVVSLGPDPQRKYDVGFQVVAVLLTDEAVVVSSDDKVKTGAGGGRTSYVVDAYERLPPSAGAAPEGGPGRRLWRYECDEHAHDLCPATGSSGVIYVALPHSRRIVAIDGTSGTWLVDVFSGSAAAPTGSGKPLRIALARPRRKASGTCSSRARPLLAVMYNGAAVAVTLHPVGSGGADD